MKKYEAMYVFYPETSEEARNKFLDRVKSIIEAEEGKVINTDDWGLRKLAYQIKFKTEGYYFLMNFEAEEDTILELTRVARITDVLLRHMIVTDEDK